jgi:uncharacterized membrane protein YqjE
MYEWTEKDEKELVEYEHELEHRKILSEKAPLMVGGALALIGVGLITLIVLMF